VRDELDTALGLRAAPGPLSRLLRLAVYAALVLVFAGPLVGVLVGAFGRVADPTQFSLIPRGFTLDNFQAAVDRGALGYLANSFVVVGGALLLQMLVSAFAAYALARKRFRGMAVAMLLILTTMMLPEEIIAVPLALVLGDLPLLHLSLIGSLAGMILPLGAWGFSILVMTEFMKEIPVELEEAARIDGAGELRVFWSIIMPLCRPALGVIGVFGFQMIWDQYLLPLIVATDTSTYTLPLALRTLRADEEAGTGIVLAASLLALLPSVLAFLAFQRSFIRGLALGALKR
jgi:multiple sugar transport system permease protein